MITLLKNHPGNSPAIERQLDSRTPGSYRVSVLISLFKAEVYLEGLLDDLAAQTLYQRGELELVAVDSSSPTGEWAILERWAASHPHLRAIRTRERESLYQAWNRAVVESTAPMLTNANADDRHHPKALELLSDTLDANPEVSLVHADGWVSRVPNEPLADNPKSEPFTTPAWFAPSMLLYYGFGFQPMWRRNLHDTIGLFEGEFKAAGDWEFALRFAEQHKALHLPLRLGSFLVSETNISFGDDTMAKESVQVQRSHLTPERIEAFYQNEGITAESGPERAVVHHDFGLRAMEFINPVGGHRRLLDIAIAAFERAGKLNPGWAAPWFNLSLCFALAGQSGEALKLLETVETKFGADSVKGMQWNRNRIQGGLAQFEPYGGLLPIPSGLNLPTSFELAYGRDRRVELERISGLEFDFEPAVEFSDLSVTE